MRKHMKKILRSASLDPDAKVTSLEAVKIKEKFSAESYDTRQLWC
jgi:hypothetical protein